ncbi:IS66-like element accessory protein TnpA [Pseudomonas syringae]|nr:transposase [Pseudomonas syringae]
MAILFAGGQAKVSARRTHLQNPSIKGDGVRVFLADTIALISRIFMRQRSSYPKSFKAQVVQECLQPGATISSVAIHHGINANVIRKWLPTYRDRLPATLPAFVPVKTPPRRAIEEMAIISLSLGDKSITVKWPSSDPDGCARFISGLAQ